MLEAPIRELVIDDDPRMVKTLVDILRAKGHAPQGARSGEEALEMLGRMPFDCVVTDIRMGAMDGLTLFRLIRCAGHTLPVIFMTAYADEDMVRQALMEGVVGAVTKPFDMERLLAFLNRVRESGSVLIVGDDPESCLAIGDALEARGLSAEHMPSAAVFGCVPRPERLSILVDMRFNRTTGLEILQELRRSSGTVPIILVDGCREETGDAVDEALSGGIHACLDSPVDVDRLFALLAELRHAKLRRLLDTLTGEDR